MERPIKGFEIEEGGDAIALLSCGHIQHVRHKPPLINRPWAVTTEGRNSALGESLNCVLCDRFEVPKDVVLYQQTPVFSEASIPDHLKKDHTTKAGVWAKIVVKEGKLRYRIETLATDLELSQEKEGIIVPEVPHSVEPLGAVQFFVEFYKAPDLSI